MQPPVSRMWNSSRCGPAQRASWPSPTAPPSATSAGGHVPPPPVALTHPRLGHSFYPPWCPGSPPTYHPRHSSISNLSGRGRIRTLRTASQSLWTPLRCCRGTIRRRHRYATAPALLPARTSAREPHPEIPWVASGGGRVRDTPGCVLCCCRCRRGGLGHLRKPNMR